MAPANPGDRQLVYLAELTYDTTVVSLEHFPIATGYIAEYAEKTFPGTAGVVVAMDAKTGFLLALVDRPAPDPNKMSGRISAAELAAIHSDPLQPELSRPGVIRLRLDCLSLRPLQSGCGRL